MRLRQASSSGIHSGKRLYFTIPRDLWAKVQEAEAKAGVRWFEEVRQFLARWVK